jgi:hypothetical protein
MTFGPTDDALMSTGETHCHVKIGTEWELLGEVRLITNPTCLEALAEGVEVVLGVRKDTPIDSSIMAAAIHEGLTRTATE